MLRSFAVQNWKPFEAISTLAMVATREQRYRETLARTSEPAARLLPIAALFGANAAGKSSLVQDLGAFKDIVTDDGPDNAMLPVHPYLFTSPDTPTTLMVEFVTIPDDLIYRYTLKTTQLRIVEESLTWIRSTVETPIFARENDETLVTEAIMRNGDVVKYVDTVDANETLLRRLGTRFPNFPETQDIVRAYRWFLRVLQVVTPESRHRFSPAQIKTHDVFRQAMSQKLSTADTGIVRVEFQPLTPAELNLDWFEREDLGRQLLRDGGSIVLNRSTGNIDLLSSKNGGLVAERLIAVHRSEDGEEYSLPLAAESDGTVRFFDLLPIVFGLDHQSGRDCIVYVVDELDRSMHFLLMLPVSFVQKKSAGQGSELIRLSDLSDQGIPDSTDLFTAFLAG